VVHLPWRSQLWTGRLFCQHYCCDSHPLHSWEPWCFRHSQFSTMLITSESHDIAFSFCDAIADYRLFDIANTLIWPAFRAADTHLPPLHWWAPAHSICIHCDYSDIWSYDKITQRSNNRTPSLANLPDYAISSSDNIFIIINSACPHITFVVVFCWLDLSAHRHHAPITVCLGLEHPEMLRLISPVDCT
jgi:hypothetical protein